jgi:hypothetical protein
MLLDRFVQDLASVPVVTLFCPNDLIPFHIPSGSRATSQAVMHRTRQPKQPNASHGRT